MEIIITVYEYIVDSKRACDLRTEFLQQ